MTMAATTVEFMDDVERRLLLLSRGDSSAGILLSAGQPMDSAKFCTELVGALLLASTRSRRLAARGVRTPMAGEGVLAAAGCEESAVFGGDGEACSRLRRTVMLRIKSVFHSRSGRPSSGCMKL